MYSGRMAEPLSNPVGTRELKTRLSEYVAEVQYRGQHIEVTRNGRPAAMLVPVEWYEANGGEQRRIARESSGG
jgi:prevent-host-death family protein